MLDLPLPEVAAAHAQVNFDDTRCFGNAASRAVPEAAWRKLEAPLAGGDSSAGGLLDHISACICQQKLRADTEQGFARRPHLSVTAVLAGRNGRG